MKTMKHTLKREDLTNIVLGATFLGSGGANHSPHNNTSSRSLS